MWCDFNSNSIVDLTPYFYSTYGSHFNPSSRVKKNGKRQGRTFLAEFLFNFFVSYSISCMKTLIGTGVLKDLDHLLFIAFETKIFLHRGFAVSRMTRSSLSSQHIPRISKHLKKTRLHISKLSMRFHVSPNHRIAVLIPLFEKIISAAFVAHG